ncbi:hypothetical protein BAE44_0013057 [Dichanthelium oligosanthes]|uniref:Uncharacterized protein n=1 Tax=Dichanthelium oligosanthes TaxID=888268 RepID=A0A1E5VLB9_9POAL|nr:hypothetical protein BAE44_0013057 [Dichanthelium oligosanthes]
MSPDHEVSGPEVGPDPTASDPAVGSPTRSRNRALVAVYDYKVGYLAFRFNLKGLFSDENTTSRPQEVLLFPPTPAARFRHHPHSVELMALVATPRSAKIVVTTDSRCTIVYDIAKSEYSSGPDLRGTKPRPILVAVAEGRRRRRDMFVTTTYPSFSQPGPHFEAFRLQGDRLRSLPVPPPPFDGKPHLWGYRREVSSYFAAGARVWVSIRHGAPRVAPRGELGPAVLPFEERAVYVHALGLLFGFKDSLLYLLGRRLFALTAVEVTRSSGSSSGELQLRKRRSRCYLMSPDQRMGCVL